MTVVAEAAIFRITAGFRGPQGAQGPQGASGGGGGGGGAPVPITTAAINTLIQTGTLTPGTTYEISDFVDGLFELTVLGVRARAVDQLELAAYAIVGLGQTPCVAHVSHPFGSVSLSRFFTGGGSDFSFNVIPLCTADQLQAWSGVIMGNQVQFTPPDASLVYDVELKNSIFNGTCTLDMSLATAGAAVRNTYLISGGLFVTGDSVVDSLTMNTGQQYTTDGYDMRNVSILGSTGLGSNTLTGDNTDTYAGFGLDTLVM